MSQSTPTITQKCWVCYYKCLINCMIWGDLYFEKPPSRLVKSKENVNQSTNQSLKLVSATLQPKISSNFPMSPAFCEGNLHLPQLSMTQGRRMSKLPRKIEIIPGKSPKTLNLSVSGCITPTPNLEVPAWPLHILHLPRDPHLRHSLFGEHR